MAMNATGNNNSAFSESSGKNGYWKKIGLIGICSATLLGAGSLYAESGHKGRHGDCQDEWGTGGMHHERHHQVHEGRWQHHKGEGGYHDGDGAHLQRMTERLQLTDDQRNNIEGIFKSAREEGEVLRSKSREAKVAVKDALRNGAAEKELRKLARAAADARVDLMLHKRRTHAAAEAELTGEQKAEMQIWREEMKAHWRERGREAMKNSKQMPQSE